MLLENHIEFFFAAIQAQRNKSDSKEVQKII